MKNHAPPAPEFRIPEPGYPKPDEPVNCPYCGSDDTECIALWATVALTEQYVCRGCYNYFEHVRRHPAPPKQ